MGAASSAHSKRSWHAPPPDLPYDSSDVRTWPIAVVSALALDWKISEMTFGIERAALASSLRERVPAADVPGAHDPLVADILSRCDPDNLGLIDNLELAAGLLALSAADPAAKATLLFDLFDFEGRGFLEYDELGLLLGALFRGMVMLLGGGQRRRQPGQQQQPEEEAKGSGGVQAGPAALSEALAEARARLAAPSDATLEALRDATFLAADADCDGAVGRGEWLQYAVGVASALCEHPFFGEASPERLLARAGLFDDPRPTLVARAAAERAVADAVDLLEAVEEAVVKPLVGTAGAREEADAEEAVAAVAAAAASAAELTATANNTATAAHAPSEGADASDGVRLAAATAATAAAAAAKASSEAT